MPQRVKELHSIMPIDNLGPVKTLGILCHDEAIKLPHADVSMQKIQDKRADKSVPICNPMLFSRIRMRQANMPVFLEFRMA